MRSCTARLLHLACAIKGAGLAGSTQTLNLQSFMSAECCFFLCALQLSVQLRQQPSSGGHLRMHQTKYFRHRQPCSAPQAPAVRRASLPAARALRQARRGQRPHAPLRQLPPRVAPPQVPAHHAAGPLPRPALHLLRTERAAGVQEQPTCRQDITHRRKEVLLRYRKRAARALRFFQDFKHHA